jgi:hypothetical protein
MKNTVRPELRVSDCSQQSVRPELVEGLSFLLDEEQRQGFDKLIPNGFGKY